jgi:hypothetical protein
VQLKFSPINRYPQKEAQVELYEFFLTVPNEGRDADEGQTYLFLLSLGYLPGSALKGD